MYNDAEGFKEFCQFELFSSAIASEFLALSEFLGVTVEKRRSSNHLCHFYDLSVTLTHGIVKSNSSGQRKKQKCAQKELFERRV